jgi:hypothetical protein
MAPVSCFTAPVYASVHARYVSSKAVRRQQVFQGISNKSTTFLIDPNYIGEN